MTIRVSHPNGYSGVLYGESSMSIYCDGREVLHTGFRSINTKEELMKVLEDMPELVDVLHRLSERFRDE